MSEHSTPEEWLNGIGKDITADVVPIAKAPARKPKRYFSLLNTNTIMSTDYPETLWVVPEYLPEGFTVLAGRQKLGKTWLAIDWAVAVATGGFAMGKIPCDEGDVLYVDMENGPRRIQKRIATLYSDGPPDLSRLTWATETITLNEGFLEAIETWRSSVPNPKLIIIDVLTRIKPAGSGVQNAYERDYAAYSGLQNWSLEKGIAVLALHHTRKGGADDPLEALSGSNGLSAVADTTLVLDRDSSGITLYGRGRDVCEKDTALTFDGGIWAVQGEAYDVRRSNERSKILAILRDAKEPTRPNDIADLADMKSVNVRRLLTKMAVAGEILKSGYGKYVHPENRHQLENEK